VACGDEAVDSKRIRKRSDMPGQPVCCSSMERPLAPALFTVKFDVSGEICVVNSQL
jgi:hypothetical protein